MGFGQALLRPLFAPSQDNYLSADEFCSGKLLLMAACILHLGKKRLTVVPGPGLFYRTILPPDFLTKSSVDAGALALLLVGCQTFCKGLARRLLTAVERLESVSDKDSIT